MAVGSEGMSLEQLVKLQKLVKTDADAMKALSAGEEYFAGTNDDDELLLGGIDVGTGEFGYPDHLWFDSSILYDLNMIRGYLYQGVEYDSYEDSTTVFVRWLTDPKMIRLFSILLPYFDNSGKVRYDKRLKNILFKGSFGSPDYYLPEFDDSVFHLYENNKGATVLSRINQCSETGEGPLNEIIVDYSEKHSKQYDNLLSVIVDTFGEVVHEVYFMNTNGDPYSNALTKKNQNGELSIILY